MTAATLPAHEELVANILAVYDRATEDQRASGRAWYPLAGTIVTAIADSIGSDPYRVCLALAALSPRNPWRWNVADAYSFAEARAQGRTMPKATTFRRNQLRAWQALDTTDVTNLTPWVSAAPKVRAFVLAIMGDSSAVVVDVWAFRVATGIAPKSDGRRLGAIRPKDYGPIAHAYNVAANLRGEAPAYMQAITWLVAQTEGLASSRRGRGDLSFKTGTPDFVRSLLA